MTSLARRAWPAVERFASRLASSSLSGSQASQACGVAPLLPASCLGLKDIATRNYSATSVTPYLNDYRGPMSNATSVALKNPDSEIQYEDLNHARFAPGDTDKRAFTYLVLTGGRFLWASSIRVAVLKFIHSMSASKDVLALANLEVDVSELAEGSTVTVKWRGKPVFIRHRTEQEIAKAQDVTMGELRDPQNDTDRAINPKYLIVLGVCTHLGCVPLPGAGDYGGWFCPCHGSHYDISGRIRKGPAPYNLEVPPYSFGEEGLLVIG